VFRRFKKKMILVISYIMYNVYVLYLDVYNGLILYNQLIIQTGMSS